MAAHQVDVPLDDEHAAILRRLVGRLHVSPETLCSLLIASALDAVEPEPETISALLDQIPGAADRIAAGIADLDAGRTRRVDAL